MVVVVSFHAVAEVEVIDRIPRTAVTSSNLQQQASSSQQSELYYQIQLMQQDILRLRGLIEQQANDIKKLKQQRLEDYMELDRRLSQAPAPATSIPRTNRVLNGVKKPLVSTTEQSVADPQEELRQYREAIDLVLKKKNYEQAKNALNKHLVDYPNGRYAANSHYWLGEIYLQQKELTDAEVWVSSLLKEFPDHSKSEDAKFKLAQVYFEKGAKIKSKSLLEQVANSDKSVAQLARNYLDKHFPEY